MRKILIALSLAAGLGSLFAAAPASAAPTLHTLDVPAISEGASPQQVQYYGGYRRRETYRRREAYRRFERRRAYRRGYYRRY